MKNKSFLLLISSQSITSKSVSLLNKLKPCDNIRRALISTWTVLNITAQYERKSTDRFYRKKVPNFPDADTL
jgi:hypothetical protein